MEKFKQLQKIKQLYESGGNIIQYLKSIDNSELNTIEDILISYDFQSGSYIKSYAKNPEYVNNYGQALSSIINKIDNVQSIIEIGVGEATTLQSLIRNLKNKDSRIFGFDISWSRLKYAKEFLADFKISNVNLFTANLFEIPLSDNSIDVVYTSHSIEPNGGKEEEALKELYRITGRYLILLEPAYEFANNEAKARMRNHGYVTELYPTALRLGYKIIEHRLFEFSSNPLNPTGLIVIEKNGTKESKPESSKLVCPISHTELIKHTDSFLYSRKSFMAYPVLEGIPCLLKENSILAIHLVNDYQEFKNANDIAFEKH
jgi:ubiquinone/menaquinone biosynthesis C-methylase UbiE/uncharacterized protein YbaR (Trm112 family)